MFFRTVGVRTTYGRRQSYLILGIIGVKTIYSRCQNYLLQVVLVRNSVEISSLNVLVGVKTTC